MKNVIIAMAIASLYATPVFAGEFIHKGKAIKHNEKVNKAQEKHLHKIDSEQKSQDKSIKQNYEKTKSQGKDIYKLKSDQKHNTEVTESQSKEINKVQSEQKHHTTQIQHNTTINNSQSKTISSHTTQINHNTTVNKSQSKSIGNLKSTQSQQATSINHLNSGQKRQNKQISRNTKVNHVQRKTLTRLNTGLTQNQRVDAQTRQNLSALSTNVQNYELRTNNRIRYLNGRVNHLHHQLNQVKGAIALSYAMSNNHFDLSPGAGPQLSIGGGFYSGESAGDIALGAPVSRRVFVSANAGYTTTNQYGVGVGATIKLSN